MKIVQINSVCGRGSTGKICVDISKLLSENGVENYIFYTSNKSDYPLGIRYMNSLEVKFQALKSHVLGNYGFNSQMATKKLLKKINEIAPDIVHLHNIHGHNVHLGMLFSYLKKKKIKVFWTFHDCWAFTAYCPHFTFESCEKWKDGCNNCPQLRKYSWIFDRSEQLFKKKKELLTGVDLTIVTPSKWLAHLVEESYLSKFRVNVINNGIDLNVFRPTPNNIRKKYNLNSEKNILLGVAFGWGKQKGLDVFIELASRLDNEKYQIVLVGTTEQIDRILPSNIISIHKTQNQMELAEIYTSADLLLNPTREENYPTVNMEAIACGTPVLTFRTGGSPEMLDQETGFVVECDDVDAMESAIIKICEEKLYSLEKCLAKSKEFDANSRFKEYLELYEAVL